MRECLVSWRKIFKSNKIMFPQFTWQNQLLGSFMSVKWAIIRLCERLMLLHLVMNTSHENVMTKNARDAALFISITIIQFALKVFCYLSLVTLAEQLKQRFENKGSTSCWHQRNMLLLTVTLIMLMIMVTLMINKHHPV